MHDGDLVPVGQQVFQLVEQAGTDDHRVWRIDGHLHGHGCADIGHVAASLGLGTCSRDRIWRTTAPGLRRLVSTRMVATRRYSGARLAISARYFSARSGPASSGRTVLPPVRRTPSAR